MWISWRLWTAGLSFCIQEKKMALLLVCFPDKKIFQKVFMFVLKTLKYDMQGYHFNSMSRQLWSSISLNSHFIATTRYRIVKMKKQPVLTPKAIPRRIPNADALGQTVEPATQFVPIQTPQLIPETMDPGKIIKSKVAVMTTCAIAKPFGTHSFW
jgi:hypothetical protein